MALDPAFVLCPGRLVGRNRCRTRYRLYEGARCRMKVTLHTNATTTPRVRAYIQDSKASVANLFQELGVSETTVRRWKKLTQSRRGRDRGLTAHPPRVVA